MDHIQIHPEQRTCAERGWHVFSDGKCVECGVTGQHDYILSGPWPQGAAWVQADAAFYRHQDGTIDRITEV